MFEKHLYHTPLRNDFTTNLAPRIFDCNSRIIRSYGRKLYGRVATKQFPLVVLLSRKTSFFFLQSMILHEQKQVIASDFYRPFFTFHVLSLASEEELCKIVYVISTVFRPETFRSDRLYPTFTETCLFV